MGGRAPGTSKTEPEEDGPTMAGGTPHVRSVPTCAALLNLLILLPLTAATDGRQEPRVQTFEGRVEAPTKEVAHRGGEGSISSCMPDDTWTDISETHAPSKRTGHTAIWTGHLMIVWGGVDDTGPLNTGGRYDPVTDRWSPTSTVDAPPAREHHTAIWTGKEMI